MWYIIGMWLLIVVLGLIDGFTHIKLGKGLRFVAGELALLLIIILALAIPSSDRSASFWWAFSATIIFLQYFFGRATWGPND